MAPLSRFEFGLLRRTSRYRLADEVSSCRRSVVLPDSDPVLTPLIRLTGPRFSSCRTPIRYPRWGVGRARRLQPTPRLTGPRLFVLLDPDPASTVGPGGRYARHVQPHPTTNASLSLPRAAPARASSFLNGPHCHSWPPLSFLSEAKNLPSVNDRAHADKKTSACAALWQSLPTSMYRLPRPPSPPPCGAADSGRP